MLRNSRLIFILLILQIFNSCSSQNSIALSVEEITLDNIIKYREGFRYPCIQLNLKLVNQTNKNEQLVFSYYDNIQDSSIAMSNIWIGSSKNDTIYKLVIQSGETEQEIEPGKSKIFKLEIAKRIGTTYSLADMENEFLPTILNNKLFIKFKNRVDSVIINSETPIVYELDDIVVLPKDSIAMHSSLYSNWINKKF